MSTDHSITVALSRLKAGDPSGARVIWDRYHEAVARLAVAKFGAAPKRAADEEDVALSVLFRLVDGAAGGRFPDLIDRDDLMGLLVVMTSEKVCGLIRKEHARKRGSGRLRLFSDLDRGGEGPGGLEWILGTGGPSPEVEALIADQVRHHLDLLVDETLREIAAAKFEGHTNEEIAGRLEVSTRTVERKVRLIRQTWEAAAGDLP